MVYQEQLENKHHYMLILQEADVSRRQIERNYTSDKAEDYRKTCSIRNAAFVELIKLNVPYVDMGIKIRIVIDNENYDMDKDTLRNFLGDETYCMLMEAKQMNTVSMLDVEVGTHLPDGMAPIDTFSQAFQQQYGIRGSSNFQQQHIQTTQQFNNPQPGFHAEQPVMGSYINSPLTGMMYPPANQGYNHMAGYSAPLSHPQQAVASTAEASFYQTPVNVVIPNAPITSQQQAVTQMESVLENFAELLKQMENKINTPEDGVEELKAQLEIAKRNEIDAKSAEKNALSKLDEAIKKKTSAEQNAKNAQSDIEKYKAENQRLTTNASKASEEGERIRKRLETSERALNDALASLDAAEKERLKYESLSKSAVNERKIAEKSVEDAEKRALAAEKIQEELQQSIISLKTNIEELKTERNNLYTDKESLTIEKNKLEQEIQTLSSKNITLSNENAVILKEKEDALKSVQAAEENIQNEINSSTEELRKMAETAQQKLEEYEKKNADLIQQNNEELMRQLEESNYLAYYDKLTDTKNKNAFNKEFVNYEKNKIALIIFGIRYMKMINDKHGRQMGDDIIYTVANTLKRTFLDCEIYRIVGDEFAIVTSSYSKETKHLCQQVKKQLLNDCGITTAFGIAIGNQCESLANMVSQAESYYILNKESINDNTSTTIKDNFKESESTIEDDNYELLLEESSKSVNIDMISSYKDERLPQETISSNEKENVVTPEHNVVAKAYEEDEFDYESLTVNDMDIDSISANTDEEFLIAEENERINNSMGLDDDCDYEEIDLSFAVDNQ